MDRAGLSEAMSPEDVWKDMLYRRIGTLCDQVGRLKVEREQLKSNAHASQANAESEPLRNQVALLQRDLKAAAEDSLLQKRTIQELQETIRTQQNNSGGIRDLKSRLDAANEELDKFRTENQDLRGERDRVLQDIDEWRIHFRATEGRNEAYNAEIVRLREVVTMRDQTITAQANRITVLEASKLDVEECVGSLKAQLSDEEELSNRLEVRKSELSEQLQGVQRALQTSEEVCKRESEKAEELASSLSAAMQRQMEQQNEIYTLRTTVESIRKLAVHYADQEIQAGADVAYTDAQVETTTIYHEHAIQSDHVTANSKVQTSNNQTELLVRPSSTQSNVLAAAPTPPNTPDKKPSGRRQKGLPATRQSPRFASSVNNPSVVLQQTATHMEQRRSSIRTTSNASFYASDTMPETNTGTRANASVDLSQMPNVSPNIISYMPRVMLKTLAQHPVPEMPMIEDITDVTFTREEVQYKLSSGLQDMLTIYGDRRPSLAVRFNLQGCLFVERRMNPWLPPRPGEHGYAFMDKFGSEDEKPGKFAVFIPADEAANRWRYYGQYILEPVTPVYIKYWNNFSIVFKDAYCKAAYRRLKGENHTVTASSNSTLDSIAEPSQAELQHLRARYEAGDLRIPCMQMLCVEYPQELVTDVTSGRRMSTRLSLPTWKRKESPNLFAVRVKRPHLNS